MSTITIPLPDEDLTFLRAYPEAHGISAEAFLARQAHNLRVNLQKPLSPEVVAASGTISPDVSGEGAYPYARRKKAGVTVTMDINVLLDVFQKRQPHYAASAQVVSMVTSGTLMGVCRRMD